jgi:hypothetical protein
VPGNRCLDRISESSRDVLTRIEWQSWDTLQSKCDEYSHATVHYITLYKYSLLIQIRAFSSDGCTTWVRRYCNISKGFDAYCTTSTSRYVLVRTVNLTSQMTRLSEVSNAE